jgi:hypothetical protein
VVFGVRHRRVRKTVRKVNSPGKRQATLTGGKEQYDQNERSDRRVPQWKHAAENQRSLLDSLVYTEYHSNNQAVHYALFCLTQAHTAQYRSTNSVGTSGGSGFSLAQAGGDLVRAPLLDLSFRNHIVARPGQPRSSCASGYVLISGSIPRESYAHATSAFCERSPEMYRTVLKLN